MTSRPEGRPARRSSAPRRRRRALRGPSCALPCAIAALACAAGPSAAPRFTGAPPEDALEIRLEFGEGADLDLFVTDPRKEALYFGNNPSRGGGVLDVDRRCDDPTPRIERARFDAPRPGRYRVGVSYDRSCGFRSTTAAFRVEIVGRGLALEHAGAVEPGAFAHVVLEFDVPPADGPR